jgi:RNA polymerase sigma factor (sigma-70 family)
MEAANFPIDTSCHEAWAYAIPPVSQDDPEQIVAAWRAALRRTILGTVPKSIRSRVDESDLLQETILRLLSAQTVSPPPEDEAATLRWLRSIYRHVMLDVIRMHHAAQRTVRREEELEAADEQGPPQTSDTCQMLALIQKEKAAILNQCLGQLSEDDQQVLVWRYREGLSMPEIATRGDWTEAAARKRCARAVQRLQLCLDRTYGCD